jgi:hypothetical protein
LPSIVKGCPVTGAGAVHGKPASHAVTFTDAVMRSRAARARAGRRCLGGALQRIGGVADAWGNASRPLLADMFQFVAQGAVVYVGRAAEDDAAGLRGVAPSPDGLG